MNWNELRTLAALVYSTPLRFEDVDRVYRLLMHCVARTCDDVCCVITWVDTHVTAPNTTAVTTLHNTTLSPHATTTSTSSSDTTAERGDDDAPADSDNDDRDLDDKQPNDSDADADADGDADADADVDGDVDEPAPDSDDDLVSRLRARKLLWGTVKPGRDLDRDERRAMMRNYAEAMHADHPDATTHAAANASASHNGTKTVTPLIDTDEFKKAFDAVRACRCVRARSHTGVCVHRLSQKPAAIRADSVATALCVRWTIPTPTPDST
jgi:hypothetical protein